MALINGGEAEVVVHADEGGGEKGADDEDCKQRDMEVVVHMAVDVYYYEVVVVLTQVVVVFDCSV